jgi:hypothetical protein
MNIHILLIQDEEQTNECLGLLSSSGSGSG